MLATFTIQDIDRYKFGIHASREMVGHNLDAFLLKIIISYQVGGEDFHSVLTNHLKLLWNIIILTFWYVFNWIYVLQVHLLFKVWELSSQITSFWNFRCNIRMLLVIWSLSALASLTVKQITPLSLTGPWADIQIWFGLLWFWDLWILLVFILKTNIQSFISSLKSR